MAGRLNRVRFGLEGRTVVKRVALAIALLWCAAPAVVAQQRPKAAWTEPGVPALCTFFSVSAAAQPRDLGKPVAWSWVSVSPGGEYAVFSPSGSPLLLTRNLATGEDHEVADLHIEADTAIAHAEWSDTTLWVVLRGGTGPLTRLYAIDPRVPVATPSSGPYEVEQVQPATGGKMAYALAKRGPGEGAERLLLACSSDAPGPRLLAEREVVEGGRINESGGRIAYWSTRPDRAGFCISLYDRAADQEVPVTPEGRAFGPVFAQGFTKAAYTTRQGIVVRAPGEPGTLVMKHLPDRRFARNYQFTPDGGSLLVEVPADKADTARSFILIPLANPSGTRTLLTVECAPGSKESTLAFSPDGRWATVVVHRSDADAPDGLCVLDLTGERSRPLAFGTIVSPTIADTGKALAFVAHYKDAVAADLASLVVVDPLSDAPPRLSLSIRGRAGARGFSVPVLSLAFAPGGERLLVRAMEPTSGRPRAFAVDAPGAPARRLSGDHIVQDARWADDGGTALLMVESGYSAEGSPVGSVLSVDASSAEPEQRLLSDGLKVTDMLPRADGSVVVSAEVRGATKKLVLSERPAEQTVLCDTLNAADPIWAPDGSTIAFTVPVGPGFSSVYTIRPGAQPIPVSGEILVVGPPVWLADSRQLLLVSPDPSSSRRGATVGWIASAGGGVPRRLGPLRHGVQTARGSIVYAGSEPQPGIYSVAPDGSAPTLVAAGYEGVLPSPDGSALVVFREVAGGLEAAFVADGAQVPIEGAAGAFVWSPDSQKLALLDPGGVTITFLGRDGHELGRAEVAASDLVWSPDSTRLAGIVRTAEGKWATACWDPQGKEQGRVPWPPSLRPIPVGRSGSPLPIAARLRPLDWSPDGGSVHFVGFSEDGLVEMRTVLWSELACFPSGMAGSLADYSWSPSGSVLASLTYVVAKASEEGAPPASPRVLTTCEGAEGRPRVVSGEMLVDGFDWLPDGRLTFWCSEGRKSTDIGTFVVNADGSALFRVSTATAATWPVQPRPQRYDVVYRAPEGTPSQ